MCSSLSLSSLKFWCFLYSLEVFHHFWKLLAVVSSCVFLWALSWWSLKCSHSKPVALSSFPGPTCPSSLTLHSYFSAPKLLPHILALSSQSIFCKTLEIWLGFPGGSVVKNPPANANRHRRWGFDPWVGKIPWRRKWQLTPVFLPEKSCGQRSLVGYRPQGHKESDTWVNEHAYSLGKGMLVFNEAVLYSAGWIRIMVPKRFGSSGVLLPNSEESASLLIQPLYFRAGRSYGGYLATLCIIFLIYKIK